jgi:hypothetical protein
MAPIDPTTGIAVALETIGVGDAHRFGIAHADGKDFDPARR